MNVLPFVREHRSGLYSTSAFYLGKAISETLLQLIIGLDPHLTRLLYCWVQPTLYQLCVL